MNELEGVLTIKNKEKRLIAIVYNDMHKRSQVFYKVVECGAEDIKQLLDTISYSTDITKEDIYGPEKTQIISDQDF